MTKEPQEFKMFDEKFHCGQTGCNCADGVGSMLNIKSFIQANFIPKSEIKEAIECLPIYTKQFSPEIKLIDVESLKSTLKL